MPQLKYYVGHLSDSDRLALDIMRDPHSLGIYETEDQFMDVTEAEHSMEDSLEHPLR